MRAVRPLADEPWRQLQEGLQTYLRLVAANADLAHVVPAEVEAANRFCAPAGATALKLAKARFRQIMTRMTKGGILERSGTDHSDPEDD